MNLRRLDADIMRHAAPVAAYMNGNARMFVSRDVGCFTYSTATSTANLVALCKQ